MSVPQIKALIDFLESQPELALGRNSRTKEGRSVAAALWQECAAILNNVSPDCMQKTPVQWRFFYNEFKHKMMKKIRSERLESNAGIGPPKPVVLTPLQERLYTILGRQVDDPIPAARSYNTSTLTNVTINEADGPPTKDVKEDSSDDDASLNNSDHESEPAEYYWLNSLPESEKLDQQSKPSCSRIKNEIPEVHVDCSPADPGLGFHAGESKHVKSTRLHAQRQRRRRRQVIPDPSMRMAMQMLKEMKNESAQALRANARATNRLAAAIETISERLKEPIRIIIENSSSTTMESGTIFRVNVDPDKK